MDSKNFPALNFHPPRSTPVKLGNYCWLGCISCCSGLASSPVWPSPSSAESSSSIFPSRVSSSALSLSILLVLSLQTDWKSPLNLHASALVGLHRLSSSLCSICFTRSRPFSEVCNNFVCGFPYYLEEFVTLSFDELETTSENSEHVSLDAFQVSMLRDHSIGNLGHHESSLASDDLLQSTSAHTSSSDVELGLKKTFPSNMKRTVNTQASLNLAKGKAQLKTTIAEPSTNVKRRLRKENCVVADIEALTDGPVTRSRSRLIRENLANDLKTKFV